MSNGASGMRQNTLSLVLLQYLSSQPFLQCHLPVQLKVRLTTWTEFCMTASSTEKPSFLGRSEAFHYRSVANGSRQ